MITRARELEVLKRMLGQFPVVGITGARQVGKTTLAQSYAAQAGEEVVAYDLENPEDRARLSDPMLTLKRHRGLVVIDEIQLLPGLFPVLRVLADRRPRPARFLILGSASPDMLRQGSETLAGRIGFRQLRGFSLSEVGADAHSRLWLRGGFPRSFLARSLQESVRWRQEFTRAFLERDLPQLGIRIQGVTLQRFWSMLAHYHGQTWNASEFARSFGVADTTVRNYLDILTSAMVVRQLPPWHENISKRQVKSPKIYIADSGILHALLNQPTLRDLEGHPKVGASWEGFVLEQVVNHLQARAEECFFWSTYAGAELDLLIIRGRQRIGFEAKRTVSPKVTPSMRQALNDLHLQQIDVIHAGEQTFPLGPKMRAVSFARILTDIRRLRA
jgi:predicted AAA+ superfamily ATPase